MPPKTLSGVLTMPAFLTPVSSSMRTVSARVFERLLCGNPAIFIPEGGQIALHKSHMLTKETAAGQHLDESKGCFSCHVNMDPLAKIFSYNFPKYVGGSGGEYYAMQGELGGVSFELGHGYIYGLSPGLKQSTGAFLGEEVTGIKELGQKIAKADLFYSCGVQRAFENIYGRPIRFDEADFVKSVKDRFKAHRSYNKMVRELVTGPTFEGKN